MLFAGVAILIGEKSNAGLSGLGVGIAVAASVLVQKLQMTKDAINASTDFTCQSNGRVFGVTILSLLAFMVLLLLMIVVIGAVAVIAGGSLTPTT